MNALFSDVHLLISDSAMSDLSAYLRIFKVSRPTIRILVLFDTANGSFVTRRRIHFVEFVTLKCVPD
jgi:hypothetical protein